MQNTGSVYQRGDGKWCAALMINGKRKVLYGKTEREAKRKLAQLQGQVATTGAIPDAGKRTVANLFDTWLASAELKPKTLAGYKQTLVLILPRLGSVKLSNLEPVQLQWAYTDLGKTSKRNAYRAHLHHVLKLAMLWGWLVTNPAERVLKRGIGQ